MHDTSTRERLLGVSLSAMLLVAAIAGAVAMPAAAAGNAAHDDETTVTTATSDILTGTTVGNVEGSPDNYTVARVIADTNDSRYAIEHQGSGYRAYENSSLNFEGENSTHQFLSANISHDEIVDLEHEPGENVTIDSIVYNTTNVSESNAVSETVQAYVEFTNDTGSEVVTDAEVDDGDLVTVSNESGWFLDTDKSEVTAEDRTVPAEDGTYYIIAGNSTVGDDFSRAMEESSAEDKLSKIGVLSSWGPNAYVKVTDGTTTTYAPVYAESAPDDAEGIYAVAKTMDGKNTFAVHGLSETFDAGDEVTITAASGTGTDGWWWGYTMNGLSAFTGMLGGLSDLVSAGGFSLTALGIGVAASRRRFGA